MSSGHIKNVVNIQNNKLDFYVNGTNRFDISLRGDVKFRVSEDTNVLGAGAQIRAIGFADTVQAAGANFLGNISNIDNHSIGDLSDVNITSITDGQLLQWDNGEFVGINSDTVGSTSLLFQVGTDQHNLDLTERITFSGTADEISVSYDADTTNLTFSLPSLIDLGTDSNFIVTNATFTGMVETTHLFVHGTSRLTGDVIIDGNLTVNGTHTIINSEIKLIEDSLITLGYSETGGAAPYDIGFRGKYEETASATNSAVFFYDKSNNDFIVMDKYHVAGESTSDINNDIDITGGEYANFLAGGIRLAKSQTTRALADVSLYNLSHSTSSSLNTDLVIPATNIIDCSNLTGSTAVLSGLVNITAWKNDLSSWAQNISNYSIIYKGSGDITVNFMTVFELNSNFHSFQLSTDNLTVRETNSGSYNVETRVLPLGHQIIAT